MSILDHVDLILELREQRISWAQIGQRLGMTGDALRVAVTRAKRAGTWPQLERADLVMLQVMISSVHDRWLAHAAAEHKVPASTIVESALRHYVRMARASDARRFSAPLHAPEHRVPVRRTFNVPSDLAGAVRRKAARSSGKYESSLGYALERALESYAAR